MAALLLSFGSASAIEVVDTPNGTWTAYPGQQPLYKTSVQPPINANGSSTFKANGKAVIPVKFGLSSGLGPFVFESIYSDNTSINDGEGTCSTGSGTDHANDCAFLSFTPNTPLSFTDITNLTANYSWIQGDCHGGSLRWTFDVLDGTTHKYVHLYYGTYSQFGNGGVNGCGGNAVPTANQTGVNMIDLGQSETTLGQGRFDLNQDFGGPFYGTYAETVTALQGLTIVNITLVLDSGWGGDQKVTLTSATIGTITPYTDTFTPQLPSPLTPTCPTQQALIQITKTSVIPPGPVNEPVSIQPHDDNGIFRIVNCRYMYNLATSSLSSVGTYTVYAIINGVTASNPAVFGLK